MEDVRLRSLLRPSKLNRSRERAAPLESARGRMYLRALFERVQELLRLDGKLRVSLCGVRTLSQLPANREEFHNVALSFYGARVVLHCPLELIGNQSKLQELTSDILEQRLLHEWPDLRILPQPLTATSFEAAALELRLETASGVFPLIIELDTRALSRLQTYSALLPVPLGRKSLLMRATLELRVEYHFEVRSLATLLAIKQGGNLSLTNQGGESEGWRLRAKAPSSSGSLSVSGHYLMNPSRLRLAYVEKQLGGKKMKNLNTQYKTAVENLGVSLSVELGVLEVSVSELIDLCPGKAIEFDVPLNESLRLRAGEETIAEAKLVERDQRLMLQVTKVFCDQERNLATEGEKLRLPTQYHENESERRQQQAEG